MATPEILDRVRKLLALATDKAASENEARNAAFIAAKLMKEHSISMGAEPPKAYAYAPQPPSSGPTFSKKPKHIISQFNSTCKACRLRIAKGENIYWAAGEGAVHSRCKR